MFLSKIWNLLHFVFRSAYAQSPNTGVHLVTRHEYKGMHVTVTFEAHNRRDHGIELEIDISGSILSKSGNLPIKSILRPNERKVVGWVKVRQKEPIIFDYIVHTSIVTIRRRKP